MRFRATALVIQDNKVLLVLDRGRNHFSLPGGGVKRGEPSMAAAVRELYEETGLSASKAQYVGEYQGQYNLHKVYLLEAHGKVKLGSELQDYIWWDRKLGIRREAHVDAVLKSVGV